MTEQIPTVEMPSDRAPLTEQAAFFDAHPELMDGQHLNNFHLHLPGSSVRVMMESGRHAADMPLPNKYYSPLRMTKSLLDFNRDFDTALKESGVDIETITELMAERDAIAGGAENSRGPDFESIGRAEKISGLIRDMLVPAYQAMRRIGYSTYDIIS